MRIGEVAEAAGVQPQTIRFYERRGLLPQPRRGANGYRDYDDAALTALRFIRNGQAAGLTLVEVATILDLRHERATPCGHVQNLLAAKLLDVQRRQRELALLEAELDHLINRARTLDPSDCAEDTICDIIAPPSAPPTRADAGTWTSVERS